MMEIFETLRAGHGSMTWVLAAALSAAAAALAAGVFITLRRLADIRRSRPATGSASVTATPRLRIPAVAADAAVRAYAGHAVTEPRRDSPPPAATDLPVLGDLLSRLRRVASTLERLQDIPPAAPEPPLSVEYLHRAV